MFSNFSVFIMAETFLGHGSYCRTTKKQGLVDDMVSTTVKWGCFLPAQMVVNEKESNLSMMKSCLS